MAAFREMHVSPAKHSFGKCDRRADRQTDGRADRQTDDGQSDPNVSLCFAGDTKKNEQDNYGAQYSINFSISPAVYSFPLCCYNSCTSGMFQNINFPYVVFLLYTTKNQGVFVKHYGMPPPPPFLASRSKSRSQSH